MIRVLSLNWDSTYTITNCMDLNYADRWAEKYVNQLHFIALARSEHMVQWVGPNNDTTRWHDPLNPEQAKLAKLLLTIDVSV